MRAEEISVRACTSTRGMMIEACKKMLDELGVEPENVLLADFGG